MISAYFELLIGRTDPSGVPGPGQLDMQRSSRVDAQLLERVWLCCTEYKRCEISLVQPHMSSGWLGLDLPENIVELTAPWLTDPVCLWVQEKVEELIWHRGGVVVGLRHLGEKRGKIITGEAIC